MYFSIKLQSSVSILKSFSVVLCKYNSNDAQVVEKILFIYACKNTRNYLDEKSTCEGTEWMVDDW